MATSEAGQLCRGDDASSARARAPLRMPATAGQGLVAGNVSPACWPANAHGQPMTIAQLMAEPMQAPIEPVVHGIARHAYRWIMRAARLPQTGVSGPRCTLAVSRWRRCLT